MYKINIKDNRVVVFIGLLMVSFLVFNFTKANDNKLNYFQDRDQDGLSDEEEKALGTDWQKADTDGDGYTDGVEISSGYNPLIPAPGDRISDEDAKKISKTVQVAGIKKERKNLTQEFIAKLKARKGSAIKSVREATKNGGVVNDMEGLKQLQATSLTEKDIQELAKETVGDVDVEAEIEKMDKIDIKVLPKVTAKSERKKREKIKKEIEDYLAETGFIMVNSIPFSLNGQDDFADKINKFMTGIGDDIVSGSDLETKRSKSKLLEALGELKKVEVPYVLADVHKRMLLLLQYLGNQDEEIVFSKDDPIAMGVMIGRLQAVINEVQDTQRELDILLDKYGVNTVEQSQTDVGQTQTDGEASD